MMISASWSRISAITRSSRAAGPMPVATPGWSTPISAERKRLSHNGQGGLDNGPPVEVPAGSSEQARGRPAPPRNPKLVPTVFLDVGVGHGWDHRSQPSSQLFSSTPCIGLAVPGRPIRSLVAEDRSAGGVRDQAGPEPAGTRWVHVEAAGRGLQWAPAVTMGAKEPQVRPLAHSPSGTPSGGGPEFKSPHPAAAPSSAADIEAGASRAISGGA
jgi:hypothetical protein